MRNKSIVALALMLVLTMAGCEQPTTTTDNASADIGETDGYTITATPGSPSETDPSAGLRIEPPVSLYNTNWISPGKATVPYFCSGCRAKDYLSIHAGIPQSTAIFNVATELGETEVDVKLKHPLFGAVYSLTDKGRDTPEAEYMEELGAVFGDVLSYMRGNAIIVSAGEIREEAGMANAGMVLDTLAHKGYVSKRHGGRGDLANVTFIEGSVLKDKKVEYLTDITAVAYDDSSRLLTVSGLPEDQETKLIIVYKYWREETQFSIKYVLPGSLDEDILPAKMEVQEWITIEDPNPVVRTFETRDVLVSLVMPHDIDADIYRPVMITRAGRQYVETQIGVSEEERTNEKGEVFISVLPAKPIKTASDDVMWTVYNSAHKGDYLTEITAGAETRKDTVLGLVENGYLQWGWWEFHLEVKDLGQEGVAQSALAERWLVNMGID